MRILITCRELSIRAGSQLYTRDLALALRRAGHQPVIFAPDLGEVAAEMREAGVPTVADLEQLGAPPDLIHGQHHLQAMAAMMRYPSVPATFVCHGWLPWQEAPPRFPTIGRYIAVDTLRRDRLVLEHGIAPESVEIVHNFVDLDRFRRRSRALPRRPRKALLFSNQAGDNELSSVVRELCAGRGLDLEIAGCKSGRTIRRPELLLPDFDLVFGRGRSALEAMAVGAAVILCDIEGDGPLVSCENFAGLRALNFGVGALRRPFDGDRLAAAVDAFDPVDAGRVCEQVRSECGQDAAMIRLLRIYERILAEHHAEPSAEGAAQAVLAGSRYLAWLAPYIDNEIVTQVAAAVRDRDEAAAKLEQRRMLLETALRPLAARGEEHHEHRVGRVEQSPRFRARAALLRAIPLLRLYQRMRARRRLPAN